MEGRIMTVDYRRSEVSTLGDFAAEKGVNGQTLKNAVEKLEIKYVDKIGASHLYFKTDLITALGTTSQASKVGYVHPDKYKELQDLHGEAVREITRLVEARNSLQENYNALVAKFDELTAERNLLEVDRDSYKSELENVNISG